MAIHADLPGILKYPGSKDRIARALLNGNSGDRRPDDARVRYPFPSTPLIPRHRNYIELFGGSGELLNHKQPAERSIYGDLDSDLCTLFRVVQDDWGVQELQARLLKTEYSHRTWADAHHYFNPKHRRDDEIEQMEPLDRAFYFMCWRNAGHTCRASGYGHETPCGGRTQGFIAAARALWQPDEPNDYHRIWKTVQIYCQDWSDTLGLCDSADTLIYADPPYSWGSRQRQLSRGDGSRHSSKSDLLYRFDGMTDDDHAVLLDALNRVDAKVIVSHYADSIYDRMLRHWLRYERSQVVSAKSLPSWQKGIKRTRRVEVVWLNPQAAVSLAAERLVF